MTCQVQYLLTALCNRGTNLVHGIMPLGTVHDRFHQLVLTTPLPGVHANYSVQKFNTLLRDV